MKREGRHPQSRRAAPAQATPERRAKPVEPRRRAWPRVRADRLIPLGHRVYVLPCEHYAVIKGCSRDPLTGDALYLVLCDGDHPSWAHEDYVIDCGDAGLIPRALLARGGWA